MNVVESKMIPEELQIIPEELKLDPQKDLFFFLDKFYFTDSGAMKVMHFKRSTLYKEVKLGNLTVFKHPQGNLYSEESIRAWELKKTHMAKARK